MFSSLIGVSMALYIAVSIGANDETSAPLAGSGSLSLDTAVLVGASLASLGAVFFSQRVEETIGHQILTGTLIDSEIVLILVTVALFLTIASSIGLPVSTTHSTVGAVIGLGLAKWGVNSINGLTMLRISIGWVASPAIGLIGSYFLNNLFRGLQRRMVNGLSGDLRLSRLSAILLLFWISLTEFSRGANDIGNVTAFLVLLGIAEPFIIRLVAGVGLGLGLIFIGRRVVRTVGLRLVKIDPVSGLAAQIVVSLTLLVSTLLGLPVSGTQVLVSAIIGLGISENRYVDMKILRRITLAWIGTFIGTSFLSYLGYTLLNFI
jgi:inorganic phosphate transporter, PiT family